MDQELHPAEIHEKPDQPSRILIVFTTPPRNWGEHKLKAGVAAKGEGGIERPTQATEGRIPIPTEPALLVEVVDGDEVTAPGGIGHLPVVAAEAHRSVPSALDVQ